MVGLVEAAAAPTPAPVQAPPLEFTVAHQKVLLDLDLRTRKLKGRTEITINPLLPELKTVRLNCRQAQITKLNIEGKATSGLTYKNPYKEIPLPWQATAHQYHMLQEKVDGQNKEYTELEPELVFSVPKSVKIYEVDPSAMLDSTGKPTGDSLAAGLAQNTKSIMDNSARFSPVTIYIDFVIDRIRDGLNFVGCEEGDLQYPHVYTGRTSLSSMSCLFPCVEAVDARCTWEISIRTPRTLGDAFKRTHGPSNGTSINETANDQDIGFNNLSDEDQALDLTVLCSGDVTDEIVDTSDPTKKTTSFLCSSPVSAQHIGFAIGPFEYVNLAAFRESDEDDKLGGSAIPLHGFCLPGRAEELRNTCMPMAKAMDFFVTTHGRYPYSSYKICFLDGMVHDRVNTASLSLCSSRMLFPEDVLDPMDSVTREIVFGLASQWSGIDIIPKEPEDTWAVVGMAYYITDLFLRKLMGTNEHRFLQTKSSERVCELDRARPSIHDSGRYLWLDSSHMKLIALKAPLVLYILDRRLTKASGSTGLSRIISRIFLNANVGEMVNGALSTAYFIRMCERLGHTKLDTFFNQWVFGAGCPRFRVTQRFNKKRLVVEMQISQVQGESAGDEDLKPSEFMRDVREDTKEVYAGGLQHAFTGPMTIRIHEADGTPYEHIVEIKDVITRFEVPYSTKYKRLKRTRRHREKVASGLAADPTGEGNDEALLYSLGDVLQSPEEESDWKLSNWTKEDEERMSGESYEWIRMDADFEWICKLSINMPGYMFVSQLQQDRDVTAQYDTVQYLSHQKPLPLISTILVRTLMDRRYFHGIRTAAAAALAKHAKEDTKFIGFFHLQKAFNELFCFSDSGMTISNDFSDRAAYYVQCAILKSIATIRDGARRSPFEAREFLYSKLRENDNSNNDYSDAFYVALMMRGLAEAQASAPLRDSEDDTLMDITDGDDYRFHQKCVGEIDRHRRIDEWIPSYHNVVSIAALECKRMLALAGNIPKKAIEYLQYTQEGTYDELRVTAFSCLVALNFLKEPHILKWFLHALANDPSSYVRANLQSQLGVYLGTIAIGTSPSSKEPATTIQQHGSLIIEQEAAATDARAADLARKQTIPGALAALKVELGPSEPFKQNLWAAINSSILTVPEISALLEICDLLYEPITSMVIKFRMPCYYSAYNLGYIPAGNGKKQQHIVAFRRTNKRRTKPLTQKLTLPTGSLSARSGYHGSAGPPSLLKKESSGGKPKLNIKPPKKPSIGGGHHSSMGPPSAVGSVGTPGGFAGSPVSTPGADGKPKLKLKLKFGGPGSQGK